MDIPKDNVQHEESGRVERTKAAWVIFSRVFAQIWERLVPRLSADHEPRLVHVFFAECEAILDLRADGTVALADLIAVHFKNGMLVGLPRKLLQGLQEATPAQLSDIEILGPGTGLLWPKLNVAHYVPGLLRGIFGNRRGMAEIGRTGGLATSPAKTEAARRHGREGGRPKSATAAGPSELASARR